MTVAAEVGAVWRIESARIVATLARMTGDLGLAEDLAQGALVEALEQWPATGSPRNPGARLAAVAKRRAIDGRRMADALGRGRGPYALQAVIAEQHAIAPAVAATDWSRIVELSAALEALGPNPVVTLNRAIAVAMADGPEAGLVIVETLSATGSLRASHLLPSVRGELLLRAERTAEAAAALAEAAALATNDRTRAVLLAKAAAG